MYAKITVASKFKKSHYTSSNFIGDPKDTEMLFDFRESILIPSFSKLTVEIPDRDFHYCVDGKEDSFFIHQVKFYSDVGLVDFPPSNNPVAPSQNKW